LAAETSFEVENVQLLTMIFSGFLDWKWAFAKCHFRGFKFQNFHKETPSDPLPHANGTFGTTLPPTPFKMPPTPNSFGNPETQLRFVVSYSSIPTDPSF
jgi:hypothetical protein